jgi:hypothetical protein
MLRAIKKITRYGNKPKTVKAQSDRRFLVEVVLALNPSSMRMAPAIAKAKPNKRNEFILCRSQSAKTGSALPISNRR